MNIIEVENLEKTYFSNGHATTFVLRGISLSVSRGEFVAIMGPSGAGKSTLLHILGFLDRQTKGEYKFEGKKMNELTDDELAHIRNKKMGFVFQSFNLLPRITVLENVKLPLFYSLIPERQYNELAKKAIAAVGLEKRMLYEPSQLSGGEKQRVAIARALVNSPTIIFADEPTGNLDSKSAKQILSILSRLHQGGKTILLVTHETYVAEHAERIIFIRDGMIEEDRQIKKRSHTFVK